ncbi:MAG: translational GTPase TypA [Gammaproteobacteria bacterium]|jgi:GTP-binding protein|nr:translational GTPase TypA [Gammaproteobacteria bacterium]MBT3868892.1 translational GTPase TypA [Gammaproteobacteria bacterium]MBT4380951.1 translational GTPase TypA [Gammaproteobacteria bacterium]MBT5197891.1 translational GTPase TypA [Gammaproteobacteria bacterium]MBT5789926.1 translational GTPase TypA [Gammaproteobacteria bacterium]
MTDTELRNIAIIAHVDHGKTTLIDKLLSQAGALQRGEDEGERLMDSNDLERERGITILAKNTSLTWRNFRINIVDTPGHADFGGEVERILSMVDSVLLLVDAVEGPMPQTRFVTSKAFENGLNPIVMINKIDRDGARPDWVVDEVFELFDQLGANDEQLDFPVIYGSAIQGRAGLTPDALEDDLSCLLEAIIEKVPPPATDINGPLQMQISALDFSNYVGVIGLGRITRGEIVTGAQIVVVSRDGEERKGKILQVMGYKGLERSAIERAFAGDIVCISGVEGIKISDTICAVGHPEALPALQVDEPTISMTFQVNTSPFAGLDGKFVTSRHLKERLEKELLYNVALRVEPTAHADKFKVSGRGELHLSVLIETMRREGYELAVGRPEVIFREVDGKVEEPFEDLMLDINDGHQGSTMEELGLRKATMTNMMPDGSGRTRLEFNIPTRALIGFRSEFMTITSGTGIMNSVFSHYGRVVSEDSSTRTNGVLVSMTSGKSVAFSLNNLQARGRLFVGPNVEIYEGMIVGLHSRGNDLPVNPIKEKQLTNVRASGTDENVILTPPVRHSLEAAIEFINDEELVEVTPNHLRLRKKLLTENERKRASREKIA